MSFSRAQQALFRPLVARAFAVANPGAHFDTYNPDVRAWYETELEHATDHRSTSHCDPKRDFENAMAHFEAIIGDSFTWQLRRLNGDRNRILHEIHDTARDFDCTEEYMLAIASQAIGFQVTDLAQLNDELLLVILVSLKRQLRRQQRAGLPTDHPRHTKVDIPF